MPRRTRVWVFPLVYTLHALQCLHIRYNRDRRSRYMQGRTITTRSHTFPPRIVMINIDMNRAGAKKKKQTLPARTAFDTRPFDFELIPGTVGSHCEWQSTEAAFGIWTESAERLLRFRAPRVLGSETKFRISGNKFLNSFEHWKINARAPQIDFEKKIDFWHFERSPLKIIGKNESHNNN